jgi:hypothetical protein
MGLIVIDEERLLVSPANAVPFANGRYCGNDAWSVQSPRRVRYLDWARGILQSLHTIGFGIPRRRRRRQNHDDLLPLAGTDHPVK